MTGEEDGQLAWSRARQRAAASPPRIRGVGGLLTEAELAAHAGCVTTCPDCDGHGVVPPGGLNAPICETCFMQGRISTPQPTCPVCTRTRGATA